MQDGDKHISFIEFVAATVDPREVRSCYIVIYAGICGAVDMIAGNEGRE